MGVVVAFDKEGGKPATVDALIGLVADDMDKVNSEILKHAASNNVDMIPELANYLISSGGKRLRPMLTIAAAQMCAYQGEFHINLATAVEFMHTATLLHDDVVDESDLRRGRKSARLIWGNQACVLVGDYLLGQAFKLMVDTRSLEALRILSHAAAVIAEGEVMQLAAAHDTSTTEDAYLQVIGAKTAALFAAACEAGAAIAECAHEQQAAFESFGRNLGVAFQLVDDALDYSGKQALLGKSIGDDFREGKITLPVVLSYRRGDDEQRQFWRRAMGQQEKTDADLEQAMDLMTRHNAIEDTIERARHYGDIARDALAIFPASEHKSALLESVDFCIARVN